MTTSIGKTDSQLKTDVLAELNWQPSVNVTDIGVLVKEGTVTLNGFATSYNEKWEAVAAAKRVSGVKALADDIEVKLPTSMRRTDGDIAAAADDRIEWSATIPHGAVSVTVREGIITLEGEVEWWYQKDASMNVVQHLSGVKGVHNLITIKPKLTPQIIETAISEAFERNAILDARKIHAETFGNSVVLRGEVRNYAEREEAQRVAWNAPGVLMVDNQLTLQGAWRS